MAVSKDGTVAVAHNDRYVVEIWNQAGQHLKTLSRDPDWFRLNAAMRGTLPEGPPTLLETPRVSAEGNVWTVSHVPDANWRAALGPVRDLFGGNAVGVTQENLSGFQDSVVEVLDPATGTLRGSLRVDARLTLISNDGFAAGYRQDRVGNPYIDIWRFRLTN
jgi:hypothetical protein